MGRYLSVRHISAEVDFLGYGRKTSLWTFLWLSQGRIVDVVGRNVIMTLLSRLIVNGQIRWEDKNRKREPKAAIAVNCYDVCLLSFWGSAHAGAGNGIGTADNESMGPSHALLEDPCFKKRGDSNLRRRGERRSPLPGGWGWDRVYSSGLSVEDWGNPRAKTAVL